MTAVRKLLLVNGPNLNLLGTRQPEVYGTQTLADVEALVRETADAYGFAVDAVQSNHEGVLIDAIHTARMTVSGIVINPGGLTHTSVALLDALTSVELPYAEIHISDITAREPFRQHSYLKDSATVHVTGEGVAGYRTATTKLIQALSGQAEG